MSIAQAPSTQRLLLHNVSWQEYEIFLKVLGDRPIRVTYDRGNLELMAPPYVHERLKWVIGQLIVILALELNLRFAGGGSTTFRREDVERGLEPDQCFYFGHEPLVRGKQEIDLTVDPPPDLAIEIDITSSSLNRMGIYAALRVPELWRFDGQALRVYQLQADGLYVLCERSMVFPFLPLDEIVRLLHQSDRMDDLSLLQSFRAWVREQIAAGW
jgi:Uma2 family endonuclease